MSYSCMPNIGDIISMHNKATLHQSDRKTQDEDKQCNCRDPSTCPLKEDAKKARLYTRQPSRYKTNRWYTTEAVKRNSKLGTVATNKASSSKTKNTPPNSRKQSEMLKMQEKPF